MKTFRRLGKIIAVVNDCFIGKLKQSELAVKFVEFIQKHQPRRALVERTGPWQDLQRSVQQAAMLRSIPLPYIYWKPTTISGVASTNIKAKRIKGLETRLAADELWFTPLATLDGQLFSQFIRFDGGPFMKSNSHRHDDGPDCIALACEFALPKFSDEPAADKNKDREEAMEEEQRKEMRRQHYQSMFGSPHGRDYQVQPKEQEQQPERKTDPRLAQLAKCLPNGMRI